MDAILLALALLPTNRDLDARAALALASAAPARPTIVLPPIRDRSKIPQATTPSPAGMHVPSPMIGSSVNVGLPGGPAWGGGFFYQPMYFGGMMCGPGGCR